MSILSDKETEIVRGLRYPIYRNGTPTSAEYLMILSDAEFLALYQKMEMYVIELSAVKDKIKSEYERRTGDR